MAGSETGGKEGTVKKNKSKNTERPTERQAGKAHRRQLEDREEPFDAKNLPA